MRYIVEDTDGRTVEELDAADIESIYASWEVRDTKHYGEIVCECYNEFQANHIAKLLNKTPIVELSDGRSSSKEKDSSQT